MNDNITSLNKIDPIHRTQLIYLIVWGAFIGVGLSLYNITVVSIFMDSRLGLDAARVQEGFTKHLLENLAEAIYIAGFIGMGISLLLIYLQSFFPFSRLAMAFLAAIGGFIFYLYQGIFLQGSKELINSHDYIFWGLVGLILLNSFSFIILEGIFARLFNIQLIKRFTHRVGIGILSAGFLSALLIWFLSKGIDWEAESKITCLPILNILFWISGAAYILAFVVLGFITFKFKSLDLVQEDIKQVQDKNTFFKLWDDPYFITLAVYMMLSVSVLVLTEYLFWAAFGLQHVEKTPNAEGLHLKRGEFFSFLSIFWGFMMALGLAFKTFLYPYLIRKYDLRINLLILPVILLAFLNIALLSVFSKGLYTFRPESTLEFDSFLFFFIMILICKTVKDSLGEAIEMSVYRLYLLLIPFDLRYDIQLKLEGFVRQLSVWLSGVLLLFFLSFSPQYISQILFVWIMTVGIATIYTVFVLYKEYKRKLENTLQAEQSKANLKKLSLAENIVHQIHTVHPSQIATYLNILNILNPVIYREAILKLLDSKAPDGNYLGVIDKLLHETNLELNEIILNTDINLRTVLWGTEFENQNIFEERHKRTIDQKIEDILAHINQKLRSNVLANKDVDSAHELESRVKDLKEKLKEKIRLLPLNIEEEVQSVALRQASKLCILEAIPVLDVISKSRYFPILDNADLIRECLNTLIAAEKRLERARYIEQLTQSTLIQERIFGALLTIYSAENIKNRLILRLIQNSLKEDYQVTYQALVASSSSKSPEIYNSLIEKLDNPHFSHAAIAAIVSIGEKIFDALESAFYITGQSETIQLRIVQIYGRVGTERAVKLLLDKLDYKNQNVSTLAINTLSECGHKIDDSQLRQKINAEVQEICQILVWNMSATQALSRFMGEDSESPLMDAMESEIKNNYEKIFSLLALLYEPRSVELVRENLYSNNPEQAELALELLDVLLVETIKPILLPLLNTSTSYSEKIRLVSSHFIVEDVPQMSAQDLLIALIQRDYKWINRWTKACALYELSQRSDFKDPAIFLANAVNPDIILREIAFDALSRLYPAELETNLQKLNPFQGNSQVPALIRDLQKLHQTAVYLKFKIADFLRSIPEFEEISGLVLSEIAKTIEILDCKTGENILLKNNEDEAYSSIEEMDYFIIYSGTVLLYSHKIVIRRYDSGGFLNNYPYINQNLSGIKIIAQSNTLVFKIPRNQFNEIISLYDEIPLSILDNSRKLSLLMIKLHDAGLIRKTNTLSFSEISKIIHLKEYLENETIAQVDYLRDLDHFILQSGEISLSAKGRELQRFNQTLDIISPKSLSYKENTDILLRSRTGSTIFQIHATELQKTDELLNTTNILKKIPEFREINDLTLMEIAEKTHYQEYRNGEQLAYAEHIDQLNCLINLSKIRIRYTKNEKQEEKEIEAFQFTHALKYIEQEITEVFVEAAESNCKIYSIPKETFDRLLNLYDQLVLDIVKIHYNNTLSVIIQYLQKIYSFRRLSALDLLEIAQLVIIKQYQAGDRIGNFTSPDEMDIYLVYSGKIDLTLNKSVIREFGPDDSPQSTTNLMLHYEIQSTQPIQSFKISAQQDCTLYMIRRRQFNDLVPKYNLPIQPIFIHINENQMAR
ncbi:MAG: hypothetical protein NW226_14455 [Microscillaceae bacterium]|nr:hypothetical protein [Microscillaceae bacterium]